THDEAFIEAIVESPDDDGLRLIYADWLDERGDPRGEFIRVQVQLARLPEDDPRQEELEARASELLEEHKDEWVGPVRDIVEDRGTSPGAVFRRGFVEQLTISAAKFLQNGDAIFRAHPVQRVRLLEARGEMHRLADAPHLARVVELQLGC